MAIPSLTLKGRIKTKGDYSQQTTHRARVSWKKGQPLHSSQKVVWEKAMGPKGNPFHTEIGVGHTISGRKALAISTVGASAGGAYRLEKHFHDSKDKHTA